MHVTAFRIFVRDLAAARDFYANSLKWPMIWDRSEQGAVGFEPGMLVIIEEEDARGPQASLIGRFTGLSLVVDNLPDLYKDLKARGVPFVAPPERQFWGGYLAHLIDPSGNIVSLVE
ncbi:VOC family protein [uncultured Cohaesibacter sp.]|uniref:VOC family protein n=1 Tax=uncultured Cohaesibacter sp. TaxID=1002546 RepID=UPI0029C80EED|nr:VOC family protein [uncultured Cohaesibacter sp.]